MLRMWRDVVFYWRAVVSKSQPRRLDSLATGVLITIGITSPNQSGFKSSLFFPLIFHLLQPRALLGPCEFNCVGCFANIPHWTESMQSGPLAYIWRLTESTTSCSYLLARCTCSSSSYSASLKRESRTFATRRKNQLKLYSSVHDWTHFLAPVKRLVRDKIAKLWLTKKNFD